MPPVVTITNYLAEIGLLFGFVYHKFSGRESFACAYVNVRYAYVPTSGPVKCRGAFLLYDGFGPLCHNRVNVSVVYYGRQMINHTIVVVFERGEEAADGSCPQNFGEFLGWPH